MRIVYTRSSTIYDDSRATKEIMAFAEKGYYVTVLGWDRSGLASQECEKVFREIHDRVKFRFYDGETGNSKLEKILSRKKWATWLQEELRKVSHIDVIHSCDYDTGAVVRKYAQKHHVRYIYDIFDYYVDAHPVPSIVKRMVEKNEIEVINDAECTIICTEERKEQIKEARPKSVLVIHNSPEVKSIKTCEEEYDYAYCGSMYGGRLIKEILEKYPLHENLRFIFAGYGELSKEAANLDRKYNSFTYMGSVSYDEVLRIESKSKVISAVYNPAIRNHQLCAPNKFYEALALGKPIIVCRGTGIDKVVEANDIGIVIDYHPEDFYMAVYDLANNENKRRRMGNNARQIYENNYRWSLMKERLLNAYESIK